MSRREKTADSDVENQLVDAVIEKVEAEIPDEMVENEVDEMINSFAYRLQSQGLKLETYLQYTNMSVDQLRTEYKPQADRQVRLRLGLEKIAQLEEIKPSEEETEEEYQKLSESYGIPLENVKKMVSAEDLNADIANRKVIEFLKENAVITEAKKTEEKKPAKKKAPAKKKTEAAADTETDEKPVKKRTAKKAAKPEEEKSEG